MPARAVRPHGRLARLASVLSYRTISGKLIIGLVVLFGLASAVVSVVTAQSLNDSLMSTLRTQVQSATSTWFTCASPDNHSPGGDPDHDQQSPPGCYDSGQAPDTFLAILSSSGKVEQYHYVGGSCTLTAADQAMLAQSSGSRPAWFGSAAWSPAGSADLYPDAVLARHRVHVHQGARAE